MKIQKPYRYFGSKGRFYNEIKEIFIQSKKIVTLIYSLEEWKWQ